MKRWKIGFVVVACWSTCFLATAEEPASKLGDKMISKIEIPADESPADATLRFDKVLEQLDLDASLDLYQCSGSSEKKMAEAISKYCIAITRIELAVRKRFGRKMADDMVHAMGEKTEDDAKKAKVKVEENTALIQHPGDSDPGLRLVKISGIWKLDASFYTQGLTDSEQKQFIDDLVSIARDATPIAAKVESGDLKSVDDILHFLKPIVAKIKLPEDAKKPAN